MGFFSWKTQDTDRSIHNCYVENRKPFTVYMRDDKGNVWREDNYEGYGEFGGKDFYELLAEMNGKKTRFDGIDIAFGNEPFKSPNLTEREDCTYNWRGPEECEYQGYFYDDHHCCEDDNEQ